MHTVSSVFLVAALAVAAHAAPLSLRNGQPIHIALAGRHEAALALAGGDKGWRLDLAHLRGLLRLHDVTSGAAPTIMEVLVEGKTVVLDRERFRPDHAYLIELHQGSKVVGAAFIYLKPPPRVRGPIRFESPEASAADTEMAPLAKGTL